jgi:hypothetical protein
MDILSGFLSEMGIPQSFVGERNSDDEDDDDDDDDDDEAGDVGYVPHVTEPMSENRIYYRVHFVESKDLTAVLREAHLHDVLARRLSSGPYRFEVAAISDERLLRDPSKLCWGQHIHYVIEDERCEKWTNAECQDKFHWLSDITLSPPFQHSPELSVTIHFSPNGRFARFYFNALYVSSSLLEELRYVSEKFSRFTVSSTKGCRVFGGSVRPSEMSARFASDADVTLVSHAAQTCLCCAPLPQLRSLRSSLDMFKERERIDLPGVVVSFTLQDNRDSREYGSTIPAQLVTLNDIQFEAGQPEFKEGLNVMRIKDTSVSTFFALPVWLERVRVRVTPGNLRIADEISEVRKAMTSVRHPTEYFEAIFRLDKLNDQGNLHFWPVAHYILRELAIVMFQILDNNVYLVHWILQLLPAFEFHIWKDAVVVRALERVSQSIRKVRSSGVGSKRARLLEEK